MKQNSESVSVREFEHMCKLWEEAAKLFPAEAFSHMDRHELRQLHKRWVTEQVREYRETQRRSTQHE